jgi:hypothetical protein
LNRRQCLGHAPRQPKESDADLHVCADENEASSHETFRVYSRTPKS